MTGPDDRWRREPQDRDVPGRDVVESGPREWTAGRRRAGIVILAAVALLAGLAGGVAGQQVGLCSAQAGHELQLGVELMNQSAQSLVLRRVRAVLPLGGLQVVSQAWGSCGQLPGAFPPAGNVLPAGGMVWFTVTFRVLVACPGPDPVQFAVTFAPLHPTPPGFVVTSRLPGFVDLGQVPYSGCPAVTPPA